MTQRHCNFPGRQRDLTGSRLTERLNDPIGLP